MVYDWILRDVVAIRPEGRLAGDVAISDGRIALIAPSIGAQTRQEYAGGGRTVIPGLVDPLVRLSSARGLETTVRKASQAALRGGITTVLDLGDVTQPLTTEADVLARREQLDADFRCSSALVLRVDAENLETAIRLAEAGVVHAFQVEPRPAAELEDWGRFLEVLWRNTNRPIYVQPDEPTILQDIEEGLRVHDLRVPHHRVRPVGAALQGISNLFEVLASLDSGMSMTPRLVIPQISSWLELRLVRALGSRAVRLGVGALHLVLTQRDVHRPGGEHGKVVPPLRLMRDQHALRKALLGGQISFLTSAHEPVERWEKEQPYWDVPGGVPMLDKALRVYLRGVTEGWLTLEHLVRLGAEQPARLLGLEGKGRIDEGFDGDLVVLSDEPWGGERAEAQDAVDWSLVEARMLSSGPASVWVRGERAW